MPLDYKGSWRGNMRMLEKQHEKPMSRALLTWDTVTDVTGALAVWWQVWLVLQGSYSRPSALGFSGTLPTDYSGFTL